MEDKNLTGDVSVMDGEYSIMPLAAGDIPMCECENSTQTDYTFNLSQKTITYNGTTTAYGTGHLPSNATWSASGTGASTTSTGLFSLTKNPDGNSRRASQTVTFSLKGRTISDTIYFQQDERKVSAYTSGDVTYTANTVTASLSNYNPISCDPQTVYVSDVVTYNWSQPHLAWDTCGDRWSDKDCTTEGTSAKTYSNTDSYTFSMCDPDSTVTHTFYTNTYEGKQGSATATVTCNNCCSCETNPINLSATTTTLPCTGGTIEFTVTGGCP